MEVESSSPAETEAVAAGIAASLEPGDVVTVAGGLGAGKTTFVRGAARSLGVRDPITSPTYAIGNRYEGRVPVSHLDLYRLAELAEPDWADLEPYFEDAVVFVEWPEAAQGWLPAPRVSVRLRHRGPEHRLILVQERKKSLEITPY
jgi:tRNA threonylcarbamoyladenosine biosynthesis protein TsaE